MIQDAFTSFDTELGEMALRWRGDLLFKVELPHRSRSALQAAIRGESDRVDLDKSPRWIRLLVEDVQKHLRGDFQTFANVPLDLSTISSFRRNVYNQLQGVTAGKTITYGELAALVGSPDAARAVGAAMAHNPFPLLIPCHRVLGSKDDLRGYSAAGGLSTKARLLEIEGAAALLPVRPMSVAHPSLSL